MLLRVTLVVCSFAWSAMAAQDVIADATRMGMDILEKSKVSGATVRQCSCNEQNKCMQEFKQHAGVCVDRCWTNIGKLTTKPDQLRTCFKRQQPMLENFVSCIGANARSCVNTENGPQIPKEDFNKLISVGEQGIESTKQKLLQNPAIQPYQRIVDAALEFGNCFKNCYLDAHKQGFCFEKLGCQPLLQELQAKKSLKKCARRINWKSGAGDLCECSMHAGLDELKDFCPLLKAMAQKIHN